MPIELGPEVTREEAPHAELPRARLGEPEGERRGGLVLEGHLALPDGRRGGIVDREDETIILQGFRMPVEQYTKGDVDGSGEVDAIDLLIYFRAFFAQQRKGR